MILLGFNCSVLAQQDSINAFNLVELKAISKLLTEVEYRRMKDSLSNIEINHYNQIVNSFIAERNLWEQKEELYKKVIVEATPRWYEKPLFISGVTTLIITSLILLIK